MKNLLKGAIAVILSTAPVAALAETTQGNLNISATVGVTCDAPSPSGTLVLPFSAEQDLATQSVADTPVTVSVTCYGNPLINHVSFDNGIYRGIVTEAEDNIRYMRNSNLTGSQKDFLGYRLWALPYEEPSSITVATEGPTMGTGTLIANDNVMDIMTQGSATFTVTGAIQETSERTGVFGNPQLVASSGNVNHGSYSDTVVMTIDYN
ncbi:spore coat protein U domain-containing protein [Thalassobius vesicularis]|nr:spore coat protein U domain-containing protein [Thalassobius vesicularis]